MDKEKIYKELIIESLKNSNHLNGSSVQSVIGNIEAEIRPIIFDMINMGELKVTVNWCLKLP